MDYRYYKDEATRIRTCYKFYYHLFDFVIDIVKPRFGIFREMLRRSIYQCISMENDPSMKKTMKIGKTLDLLSNKFLFKPFNMSEAEVNKRLEEYLSSYHMEDLDFLDHTSSSRISHYADEIASDPRHALLSFIIEYEDFDASHTEYKFYEQSNNSDSKSNTEEKKEPKKENGKGKSSSTGASKEGSSTTDILDDNMEGWISYLKRVMNSSDPFLNSDDEYKIGSKLDKQLRVLDGTGKLVLAGVQIQRIKRYFRQYEADRKNILKRAEVGPVPDFSYLCKLHDLILRNLPKELLMADSSFSIDGRNSKNLRNLVGYSHIFEDYQYCYDVYMKAVAKLPSAEQDNAYNEVYNGMKVSELPDSEQLKTSVNLRVIDKLSEKYYDFTHKNSYIVFKIVNACKYMSSSYVCALYVEIKRKARYLGNEERATLQDNFIRAILRLKNLNNLPSEEQDKKIIEIVKEILHENYLYTNTGAISIADDKDHDKSSSSRLVAAVNNAQSRFFGMNKLQQTMAKMSGRWKKLSDLEEKARMATIAEEDEVVDKLDSMFRR